MKMLNLITFMRYFMRSCYEVMLPCVAYIPSPKAGGFYKNARVFSTLKNFCLGMLQGLLITVLFVIVCSFLIWLYSCLLLTIKFIFSAICTLINALLQWLLPVAHATNNDSERARAYSQANQSSGYYPGLRRTSSEPFLPGFQKAYQYVVYGQQRTAPAQVEPLSCQVPVSTTTGGTPTRPVGDPSWHAQQAALAQKRAEQAALKAQQPTLASVPENKTTVLERWSVCAECIQGSTYTQLAHRFLTVPTAYKSQMDQASYDYQNAKGILGKFKAVWDGGTATYNAATQAADAVYQLDRDLNSCAGLNARLDPTNYSSNKGASTSK